MKEPTREIDRGRLLSLVNRFTAGCVFAVSRLNPISSGKVQIDKAEEHARSLRQSELDSLENDAGKTQESYDSMVSQLQRNLIV